MKRTISTLLLAGLAAFSYGQDFNGDFNGKSVNLKPDYVFKGSALTGWHTLGNANWQANNGVITAKASGTGYLISDKSFQDVGIRTLFKPDASTEVGFLFRLEKTADGMQGILVSSKGGEIGSYKVKLDAQGKEKSREKLRNVNGIIRQAPVIDPNAPARGAGGPGGTGPRPGGPGGPGSAGAATVQLPLTRPNTAVKPGEWNQFEDILDLDVMRAYFNDGGENMTATEESNGFGAIALMVNGSGEVQFSEFGYTDVAMKKMPDEKSSSRFKVQHIQDMYYSWAAGAGDFNRDGIMDVVAGPIIYYGPDFTKSREIEFASSVSPSKNFTAYNCQYTYDFNGDGWPDVLTGPSTSSLFINPKGESRRWEKYTVVPGVQSEITLFKDIDGDGKPELIYGGGGQMKFAKPDPADPTKPWIQTAISERGTSNAHGIGVGDVNGDGLLDVLNVNGWWEHPKNYDGKALWEYHPQAFGRYGHRGSHVGGSAMGVYDVNGDKLNDVVTSLNAHGFGLAWFEQKRDAAGKISFVRHMIADDYSTKNAGDVTFSEAHGAAFADIDGDGIMDFITGKRYYSHLDTFLDPDPYGAPVVYVYKTVRDAKAPGGAKFVPELVHNRSGVGSDVLATDLNKDGAVDIVTATNRGVFIYWNTPKAGAKATAAKK
ncbi:FG-GAP repeat domain-containing protein [Mucilaginibacter sp. HD30]